MKLYVNAYDIEQNSETLPLALLTWIESGLKEPREVVVWASEYPHSDQRSSRNHLARVGVPYETHDGLLGQALPLPVVFLLNAVVPERGRIEKGMFLIDTLNFIRIMSSEAVLDYECAGCGSFWSQLPFMEQGDDAYCTNCAPRLDLFSEVS